MALFLHILLDFLFQKYLATDPRWGVTRDGMGDVNSTSGLQSTVIYFLPVNAPSVHWPLDWSIFHRFQCSYWQLWLCFMFTKIDPGCDLRKTINVFNAVRFCFEDRKYQVHQKHKLTASQILQFSAQFLVILCVQKPPLTLWLKTCYMATMMQKQTYIAWSQSCSKLVTSAMPFGLQTVWSQRGKQYRIVVLMSLLQFLNNTSCYGSKRPMMRKGFFPTFLPKMLLRQL